MHPLGELHGVVLCRDVARWFTRSAPGCVFLSTPNYCSAATPPPCRDAKHLPVSGPVLILVSFPLLQRFASDKATTRVGLEPRPQTCECPSRSAAPACVMLMLLLLETPQTPPLASPTNLPHLSFRARVAPVDVLRFVMRSRP